MCLALSVTFKLVLYLQARQQPTRVELVTELIAVVKSFILVNGLSVIKLFTSVIINNCNKLECLLHSREEHLKGPSLG